MKINSPDVVQEVTAAFYRYEKALMEDDVTAMDDLFRQAPETVRYGVGEVLYGYDDIAAFRRSRGGSPQRKLGRVEVTTYGDSFATASVAKLLRTSYSSETRKGCRRCSACSAHSRCGAWSFSLALTS